MYVLSTGFTYRMPKDKPVTAERASAIREMMDGLGYIRSNPVISRLSLLAFSVIFSAAFVPIMPVYARDRFDVGETGFSFMLAAWAIGQGASALWISARRDPDRRIPAVLIATVMFVIAVPTFALSTNFPLTLFALGMVGAAIPIWSSAVMALLQSQTDSNMIGRVMSVYSLSLQMMMLGWFLGAWIGELIGNSEMMLGGTAIYLVIHLWLIFTSPELRKL
jgi:predicted MFS family arabinose efflux permease